MWASNFAPVVPLFLSRFNFNPSMVSNHTPIKLWGEITYPFPNFKGRHCWLLRMGKLFHLTFYYGHYIDVIMTTMASQITSLTVVYSNVYSDAEQRKHQSSTSLAFVWEIHRDRWIPRTKGQLRGKCFHLMTSPWRYIVMLCDVDATT